VLVAANRIRELRLQAGYTHQALALLLGVGERTVRRWENGEAMPTAAHARRLARRLGVTVEDLGLGRQPT
jgi:transcriptional regulator with XRE-family HTH domain